MRQISQCILLSECVLINDDCCMTQRRYHHLLIRVYTEQYKLHDTLATLAIVPRLILV